MLGMTRNHVAAAYGGSIGESLGFFGVMIIREIASDRSKARRRLESYGWLDYERFHRFMLTFPEGTIALLKAAVLRQVETQKAPQSQ